MTAGMTNLRWSSRQDHLDLSIANERVKVQPEGPGRQAAPVTYVSGMAGAATSAHDQRHVRTMAPEFVA
jgi:hypothetical protein